MNDSMIVLATTTFVADTACWVVKEKTPSRAQSALPFKPAGLAVGLGLESTRGLETIRPGKELGPPPLSELGIQPYIAYLRPTGVKEPLFGEIRRDQVGEFDDKRPFRSGGANRASLFRLTFTS